MHQVYFLYIFNKLLAKENNQNCTLNTGSPTVVTLNELAEIIRYEYNKIINEDIKLVIHSKFDGSINYHVPNCDMQKFLFPDLKLTSLFNKIQKMLEYHLIKTET